MIQEYLGPYYYRNVENVDGNTIIIKKHLPEFI